MSKLGCLNSMGTEAEDLQVPVSLVEIVLTATQLDISHNFDERRYLALVDIDTVDCIVMTFGLVETGVGELF